MPERRGNFEPVHRYFNQQEVFLLTGKPLSEFQVGGLFRIGTDSIRNYVFSVKDRRGLTICSYYGKNCDLCVHAAKCPILAEQKSK